MIAGLTGDLRVVQQVCIERHFAIGRAAAEEIDGAPLGEHLDSPLPGFRFTDYNDYDFSTMSAGQGAHSVHCVRRQEKEKNNNDTKSKSTNRKNQAPADGDH